MSKKALVLASFFFLFGLHASKSFSELSPQINNATTMQNFVANDEETKQPHDAYSEGEGFYIWTTTFTKVA